MSVSSRFAVARVIIAPKLLQDVLEADYGTANIRTIRSFLSEQKLTFPPEIFNNDMLRAVLLLLQ